MTMMPRGVVFAGPEDVVAFVEAELATATHPALAYHRNGDSAGLMRWDVCAAGEAPSWSNCYVVLASRDGEFFVVLHSNQTRGPFGADHCLQSGTFIQRGILGWTIGGREVATLAGLLRHVFETAPANYWDPT